MLAAIKLNGQFKSRASKIYDTLADGVLAAEFPLRKFVQQGGPKLPLDNGGISTKSARYECP
jgi:hypothetical protein